MIRTMIGTFVLCFAMLSGVHSFLRTLKPQKAFALDVKTNGKYEVMSETALAHAMLPPNLQEFKNVYHVREALNELAYAGVRLPASDKVKSEMIAAKINGWTMPLYELDANKVPVPVRTTDKFGVHVMKSFVPEPLRIIETEFLGYDQRFGRTDQGDKPKLFETIVRKSDSTGYSTSRSYHSATYDEALRTHDVVHALVESGMMEYFPYA